MWSASPSLLSYFFFFYLWYALSNAKIYSTRRYAFPKSYVEVVWFGAPERSFPDYGVVVSMVLLHLNRVECQGKPLCDSTK